MALEAVLEYVKKFFRGTALFGTAPTRFYISNKALTSNLATLTTSAVHGITQVGTIVTIQGVDSTFDGTYAIHSIPSTTTFTYVKTTASVGTVAVSPVGVAIFTSNVTIGQLISNKVVQNLIATITTSSAHVLAVGDLVTVTIGDTIYDGIGLEVIAVPTTTTFCYIVTTASAATTAVTQGSFGKHPPLYTVPTNLTSSVKSVLVANKSTVSATFSLSFAGNEIAANTALAANSTAVLDFLGGQVLNSGEVISGAASTPAVTFSITGTETI
jgi:hypothetical protein